MRDIKKDLRCHVCKSNHSNPIITRLCIKSIMDRFFENPINRLIMVRLAEI